MSAYKFLLEASENLEGNVRKLQSAVARNVLRSVVYHTPVLTGRARSNWQVTRGKPANRSVLPHFPYDQGTSPGMAETQNAEESVKRGERVIGRFDKDTRSRTIWISNNLRYINKIDSTGTREAPPNFVRIGIIEALIEMPNVRLVT